MFKENDCSRTLNEKAQQWIEAIWFDWLMKEQIKQSRCRNLAIFSFCSESKLVVEMLLIIFFNYYLQMKKIWRKSGTTTLRPSLESRHLVSRCCVADTKLIASAWASRVEASARFGGLIFLSYDNAILNLYVHHSPGVVRLLVRPMILFCQLRAFSVPA